MPTPDWEDIYDFEELVEEANARGWMIINCFQHGLSTGVLTWRIGLQAIVCSKDCVSEFADGSKPVDALRAAMKNMMARNVPSKPKVRQATAEQLKKLDKAWFRWQTVLKAQAALERTDHAETGSDDRDDDL